VIKGNKVNVGDPNWGFYVKYWLTRIKLRKPKSPLGSQIDHSTNETSNDGGGKDLR
jgi:hypothetical protein